MNKYKRKQKEQRVTIVELVVDGGGRRSFQKNRRHEVGESRDQILIDATASRQQQNNIRNSKCVYGD